VKVQDEGETRTTIYKGVIIAKRNKGLGSNFSLLNQIDEGERLELLIPTYAPSVKGIKVLQKAHIHKGKKRVRRSKLYYLRDRNPAEFTVA
jgi:large subunit ribosomal protein L19